MHEENENEPRHIPPRKNVSPITYAAYQSTVENNYRWRIFITVKDQSPKAVELSLNC